jgi:diaminopropionate ammonia-lyase
VPEAAIYLSRGRSAYDAADRALVGIADAERAQAAMSACPEHRRTPLRPAPALARAAGVATVQVKDESGRFGLGSFKALGGAYAVWSLAAAAGAGGTARVAGAPDAPDVANPPDERPVFVCASAGNHGLSVAAGARAVGGRAQVWLGRDVSPDFVDRLRELGADVRWASGGYEAAVAAAVAAAAQPRCELVADTSWPGYLDTPLQVMRGYAVLVHEAAETMEAGGGPASHVFVQAGVGGLAGAVAGYLRDRWGERPRVVVVEPRAAACLQASAAADVLTETPAGPTTTLGRLDCRRPSLLAWRLLRPLADAFVTVTDEQAGRAAAALAEEGVTLSPCGAAGAAGLLVAASSPQRQALGLHASSRVLLIGTERPT